MQYLSLSPAESFLDAVWGLCGPLCPFVDCLAKNLLVKALPLHIDSHYTILDLVSFIGKRIGHTPHINHT